jgi:hypothetical protein
MAANGDRVAVIARERAQHLPAMGDGISLNATDPPCARRYPAAGRSRRH